METLKLNETPVRTSKNFNANNIKLENIKIPKEIPEFKNITISCETSKINVERSNSNIDLVYGLSEKFTNQVNEQANQKLKLNIDSLKNKEVQIDFKFDSNNDTLVDYIEVNTSENSKATITLKYTSDDNNKYWHNGVLKVHANKNSEINIIISNLINTNSNNFMSIENILEENAKVKYTIIDFGGENSITNYYSNLLGDSSDNSINTIYLGKENQLFDINYMGELRGKRTNINIEVQGALKDLAKKHFKGTIDFKKGCKKAKGNENEACMLLSDTAKSLALPMLLCSEEDVEGNHSSSAGKIGEKELFYIMSRGFELKESMKLMVRAKFNSVLDNIKDKKLIDEILSEIDKRLD